MEIEALKGLYARLPQVKNLAELMGNNREKTIFLEGLLASSIPLAFASIYGKCPPLLFILNDEEEAGYFYHDLSAIIGGDNVLFYPSAYRTNRKYAQRDSANEILRTEVLARLSRGNDTDFIVTYPEALQERIVTRDKLQKNILQLRAGKKTDIKSIEQILDSFNFQQEDYVYEPGQYALRGSIVDVFSYSCEYPYRIDFFGNNIDSIRTFDVQTQLSKETKDKIDIVPNLDYDDNEQEGERILFLEALSKDTLIVSKNFKFVCESIDDKDFTALAKKFRHIEIINANKVKKNTDKKSEIEFHTAYQPLFHKNFDLLKESFEEYLNDGYRIYILADSAKQHQRLKDIFEEKSRFITFTPITKTVHEGFVDNDLKVCFFTDHQIFDRFHKYNLKSEKARSGKIALSLKELQQFSHGDLIVHIDHGIGRFEGLVRVPQGDGYQEMIKITYQNNDTIYVSIHSLYKVSKYKGREGADDVRLSRIGTGAWENLKERTKKKIKDIARDLILLYARRRKEHGFAYSADSFMQQELEASFIYEDTPDQLKATNDVKADMEKPQPMDRLICGDVGFGKTEVAIRAAFKAACDGKQVAVLVPTTVLAFQHYKTFSERLKKFPVTIEYLSRSKSQKKTTQILDDLKNGKIDIIIGTHKLIGKSVHFKDLGLLIIDEEQKFGVSVKEKLRQIKTNVDTITMSATPIPRTLQFSLMGARDLSVIQTPPPNRYPIHTEVHTFDTEMILDAIRFEMSRNGQVFFVSNRINSLEELQRLINRHLPECRVVIGHGQMKPEELEDIIMEFVNYDYDVLLSTTIIENGIDIPNANTIIINNAQNFGLSDLHQMRGRVGRGNKKAFCYLLAPPLSALNTDARRRLEAIANFSDLGSGIHIAMQDLDIRGAGNLLGSEQSGFIADLGYETYQKILNEAVTEIRNEEHIINEEDTETGKQANNNIEAEMFVSDCSLDTDIEMYFPESYVPSSSERIMLYRELDNLNEADEVQRFRERLTDRFGQVPAVGEDLMKVVLLRQKGKKAGIERIVIKQGRMNLFLVGNSDSPYYQSAAFDRLLQYIANNPRRCQIKQIKEKRLISVSDVTTISEAIIILEQMQ